MPRLSKASTTPPARIASSSIRYMAQPTAARITNRSSQSRYGWPRPAFASAFFRDVLAPSALRLQKPTESLGSFVLAAQMLAVENLFDQVAGEVVIVVGSLEADARILPRNRE